MVNEDVFEYLKEGLRRGFSIDLLKQQLLGGGFLERDIDEAIKTLHYRDLGINYKGNVGFKWMKLAGIIGVVFLFLSIFYSFSIFISSLDKGLKILLGNSFFVIPLLIILMMLSLFYYIGFIRFGRRVNSKLISFCAWSTIIWIFISIIFYITSISIIYGFGKDFIQQATPLGKVASSSGNSPLNQGLGLILFVVMAALFIFYFVVQTLFSIGLIKAGQKVKFSKLSGVFDLLYTILSIIAVIIFLAIIIFNPLIFIGALFSLAFGQFNNTIITMIVILCALYLLKLLALLFASCALFDASKKFE